MRKFKTFLFIFKHSLLPFDSYYKQIRKAPLLFTIKYLLVLITFVSLLSISLKFLMFTVQYPEKKLHMYISHAASSFPPEMVITVNELGRLSTNMNQPFILFSPMERNPRPLIVIDPKADKSKIRSHDAFVLFGERRMYVDNQGSVYSFPYETGRITAYDNAYIQSIAENSSSLLSNYWMFIAISYVVALIVGVPFFLLFSVATIILVALVGFMVFKLSVKHKRTSFKSIFQITSHAYTGPLLLLGLSFVFNLSTHIPFWNLLVIAAFTAGAIYESYFEK